MFSRFIIGLLLAPAFVLTTLSAQSPAISARIQCESCALTGQKPEPFDPTKTAVVSRVEPVFFPAASTGSAGPDTTLRMLFIARVLGTSPLRLEMLDSRAQEVDRNMAVVKDDANGGKDPGTCGVDLWGRPMAVAADVKSLLPTLRFNDLVTGAWMLQRDDASQDSLLGGRPVISDLRKVTGAVTWFHSVPATPNCRDRSGRLIVYVDLSGAMLTVYNDRAIQYSSTHVRVFVPEDLSVDELRELLAAFSAASIDSAPSAPDATISLSGSRLLLAAARYELVRTDVPPPALALVIEHMNLLKVRAMSSARLMMRVGATRPIQASERRAGVQDIVTALHANQARMTRSVVRPDGTRGSEAVEIDKIPEFAALSGPTHLWPPDIGVRLADVSAEGLIVPWSEVQRHKLVYYALLNAGFNGTTLIEGDRLYERVRICQVSEDGTDPSEVETNGAFGPASISLRPEPYSRRGDVR
jgi:hypothetical protein